MHIVNIILKNLKILFRSKSAVFLILFAPLLVFILAGIAFNNSDPLALHLGVYQQESTELSQQFIDALQQQYHLTFYSHVDACQAHTQIGITHACITFPQDFSVEAQRTNTISLYVDTSKTAIVDMVTHSLLQVFSTQGLAITEDLTEILVISIEQSMATLYEVDTITLASLQQTLLALQETRASVEQAVAGLDVSVDKNKLSPQPIMQASIGIDAYTNNVQSEVNTLVGRFESFLSSVIAQNVSESLTQQAQGIKEQNEEITKNIEQYRGNVSSQQELLRTQVQFLEQQLQSLFTQLDTASTQKQAVQQGVGKQTEQLQRLHTQKNEMQITLQGVYGTFMDIDVLDAQSISRPIEVQTHTIVQNVTRFNYIFPTLLVVVISFTALLLGALVALMEKKSVSYLRLYLAPISIFLIDVGAILAVSFVVMAQVIIVLAIAHFGFGVDLLANVLTTIIILLFVVLLFVMLGILVGKFFGQEQTALLGALSLGTVFMLFSDLFLPRESLPDMVQAYIVYTPFLASVDVVRQAIIYGQPLWQLGVFLWTLIGLFVFFGLLVKVSKKF
ncbi:MAG: ABC transporter permease [Candidatus Woesearchaeota archaeon]